MKNYFLVLSLFVSALNAEVIEGTVINVVDGDSLTVLSNNKPYNIRLINIDAPERHQDFGMRSKQFLSQLCFGALAKVEFSKKDRYRRYLGEVKCKSVNVNQEMVRLGYAWAYRKYLSDEVYLGLEEEARESKRGLWSHNDPMPPWQFRRVKKSN